jgi:hypothetical protein
LGLRRGGKTFRESVGLSRRIMKSSIFLQRIKTPNLPSKYKETVGVALTVIKYYSSTDLLAHEDLGMLKHEDIRSRSVPINHAPQL